jgi:MoxR-like ATPase
MSGSRLAAPESAQGMRELMEGADYLADDDLALAAFLALRLEAPLLLEGEAGVGKTAVRARSRPIVILTSNRTRELHDALKRRCLYHWIDFPSLEREIEVVRRRVPEASVAVASARWSAPTRRSPPRIPSRRP